MKKVKQMIDRALGLLLESLGRGLSEQMKTYLRAMARFRDYSWGNVLLIASQRPRATHVAGYRTWQKLGRQVNRGEHGIAILAPLPIRRRSEHSRGREKNHRDDDCIMGFRTIHVFDFSQTNGTPLPHPAKVGGDPGIYLARLKHFTQQRRIELTYSDRMGRAEGVSRGGSIAIRKGLSPAEELSVLAHELAHELLHADDRKTSKAVRETEAEAVAYVVCKALNLDTNTASSDYIQLSKGTRKTLAGSLHRIHSTAVTMIKAITIDANDTLLRAKTVETERSCVLAA